MEHLVQSECDSPRNGQVEGRSPLWKISSRNFVRCRNMASRQRRDADLLSCDKQYQDKVRNHCHETDTPEIKPILVPEGETVKDHS